MILSSLDKSLTLIEVMSKHPSGLSLSELTGLLGYPNSTLHHILSTLRSHDYVIQDPKTKKYSLGFRLLTIGKSILDNMDIRRIAQPHLRRLFELSNETVHLAILRNGMVVYIDKIEKQGGLSLATYIGYATQPHAAAGGKVMLSELSHKAVRDMYGNRPLQRFAQNTVTDMDQLFRELETIRKQGYAIDDEEYYEGVRCIAAPVRAGGEIAASVSITGSIFTMTMEKIQNELRPLIVETTGKISSEMVW